MAKPAKLQTGKEKLSDPKEAGEKFKIYFKRELEAELERRVRERLEECTQDYLRMHPEFTPEQVANVWTAFAIANAAEASRGN